MLSCIGNWWEKETVKYGATTDQNTSTTSRWNGKTRSILIEHIQPGNPQQNAYVERYNRTVRYEWLSQYLFDRLKEVQDFATQWLWQYNHERPNMGLGGITQKQEQALAA